MIDEVRIVPGARTVAVSSGKGGVGKSTTTVALADNLTRRGYDVVVIDGDLAGPNVHLLAGVTDLLLRTVNDPLQVVLPRSPLGFRLVTPVSVRKQVRGASPRIADLVALAQLADPAQIVLVDLPPGWTDEHDDICSTLPDLIVSVAAPTIPAISDHRRHDAAWQRTWTKAVQEVRNADKRRRIDLPEQPPQLVVETMARFHGVDEATGATVTIRRSDALPSAKVAELVEPVVSLPAAASAHDAAGTPEMDTLADLVLTRAAVLQPTFV